MANQNEYDPRSAWQTYAGQDQRAAMRAFTSRYMDFISNAKTERETVEAVAKILEARGFGSDFRKGDRVYRAFRGKSLFAAIHGQESLENGLSLIAAHADSPRLDFKQRPLMEQAGVAQARTHYYGGIRKYQWLARPLAIHGVIALANGALVNVNIGEKPDDPVFCVADLLPHLAQKQNEKKISDAFDAEKLNIILGHEPAQGDGDSEKPQDAARVAILRYLRDKYGVNEEDLITAELEAVPAGPARMVGLDESLIGGYGQDDRICLYCALEALLAAAEKPRRSLAIIFWDKEEIGSEGATGASSRFLQYCVEDLVAAWEPGVSASHTLLNSMAISADVTAALDPDYQEVHEKQNAARLGFGPCFSKFTGSRGKYGASDADAEYFAWLRGILNAHDIPWQAAELGKVDLGGGGTVALFLAALGMRVIDLGTALLSMHSPFELASVADLYATKNAYAAFLNAAARPS